MAAHRFSLLSFLLALLLVIACVASNDSLARSSTNVESVQNGFNENKSLPVHESLNVATRIRPAENLSEPTEAITELKKRFTSPKTTHSTATRPSSSTTMATKTSTKAPKCALILTRPTPYVRGTIKTVYASTRHLTSYQPCGDCTISIYNPFSYHVPKPAWVATVTIPRIWTSVHDRCERTTTIRPRANPSETSAVIRITRGRISRVEEAEAGKAAA